ncbi:MAG: PAS-domain containing protein [Proteobacteria bacterium]|nr:PAS-domain containing protein [Pseudomonadota bacterium]
MTDVLPAGDHQNNGNALEAVFEVLPMGLMLFDAEDRLLQCNAAARDFFAPIGKAIKLGTHFEDMARRMAKQAVRHDGASADDWLAARLQRHRAGDGAFEEQLADGRWLRVSESPVEGVGGMVVYDDITAQKAHEREVRESVSRYQDLNEIGVALSAEKNVNRLLEMILHEAKKISNADGGTVYLYANEEASDWQPRGRIDARSGGDRRSGYDRRSPLVAKNNKSVPVKKKRARKGSVLERSDRRIDVDRRARPDVLKFAIMLNDTLKISLGGTTGKEIPFSPLRIYDPVTGKGNYKNVATVVALTGKTVDIPDAYCAEEFDFSGTKAFDAANDYRSKSFLTIPMKNKKDEVIGVLQLINARDRDTGETIAFKPEDRKIIESLASQAAVTIDNQMLLEGQKVLLDSFIQLIAGAIDEKSPYTGGHCERVPKLTEMLAEAACQATTGPFRDFQLTAEEKYELHIAGWMHDCGKVTTPEYVVDKSTKLETIYDRIETVVTRFEILKRDAEIACLKDLAAGGIDPARREAEYRAEIERLDSDCEFIKQANVGGEFMDDDKKDRVRRIAAMTWRAPDGEERPFLDENESYNLCISRGTLTAEERTVINDHIVVTIEMLAKLPFPKNLRRVPEYAGGHHEKMDGTGYPRGLRRNQMSTPARMMAIADIFEALTAADRPYKKAKSLSVAMKIMGFMKNDNHIDPDLFELFVESGVYREYAENFLGPDQIDEVDHDALLGRKS